MAEIQLVGLVAVPKRRRERADSEVGLRVGGSCNEQRLTKKH
jgi:hypothetical protein